MISKSTIDGVLNTLNIVDVIGQSIQLIKRGKNYVAICPFHSERTPSFNINEKEQYYHCFGCGAGGDLIKFYKEYQGLSFNQAMERLAEMAGIGVDKEKGRRMIPRAIMDKYIEDKMIVSMSMEYKKNGIKISYQDKKRCQLAISRIEGINKKWEIE